MITIITPIYNTGKFVIQALEAVVKQNLENYQHIIIDDHSTDDSCTLVKTWVEENNYNCLFLKNPINRGLTKTLNIALKHTKYDYFTLIGDDLWEENRLKSLLSTFNDLGKEYAILFTDMKVITEKGELITDSFLHSIDTDKTTLVFDNLDYTELLLNGKSPIPAPTVLFRTSAVKEVGGFNEKIAAEDYDMWLRLSIKYQFKFINDNKVAYRIREGSLSNSIGKEGSYHRVLTLSAFIKQAPKKYHKKIKQITTKHAKNYLSKPRSFRHKITILIKNIKVNKDLSSIALLVKNTHPSIAYIIKKIFS